MSILSHEKAPSGGGLALQPDEFALAASIADLDEPVLITRADLDRPGPTIVAVSPGMVRLTGYAAEELVGKTPRILQGPLTDRAVLDRLRATCARGEHFIGQGVNYRKDGSTYLLQWTIDPLRDAGGAITHFFSVQQDMTPQYSFAREWLDAEDRAKAALERASASMVLIAEAILVLERTKRSFQSKELGQLRARLIEASRTLPRMNPPNPSASPE